LIHLAHPWGYTAGSWMPWAFGLAWAYLAPGPTERTRAGAALPFLLSLVLVLQILPGHFQLAFQTQVMISLLIAWTVIEQVASRLNPRLEGSWSLGKSNATRALALLLALLAVFPLAALQLLPTWRLASLAVDRRDFEYLSGFAATPFHLVNYVAPGLFHRFQAWRPLVWDPFHTDREENLSYVGLVPLFFALLSSLRGFRRDPAVRFLTILVVVSLFLSLGPYAPGFRQLILLPGFSFFRAPARWSLVTALGLALLAGKGCDCWPDWPRPGRALGRFVLAAALWIAGVVGIVELALACTRSPGWPAVVRGFERLFAAMPWDGMDLGNLDRNGDPRFRAVAARARLPEADVRIPAGIAPSMFLQKAAKPTSLVQQRAKIYGWELWETATLLAALLVVARVSQSGWLTPAQSRSVLMAITFVDLWVLGRHRLLDVAPLRPLTEQSPLLARLAREPRGARVIGGGLQNLPMLVQKAPLAAYRTLDLPALGRLTDLARELSGRPPFDALARQSLRVIGADLRIFDPMENRIEVLLGKVREPRETVSDPALAGWLFGERWTREQRPWVQKFSLGRCGERSVRGWLVPIAKVPDPLVFSRWSGDPQDVLPVFQSATPVQINSPYPEKQTVFLRADEPTWLILTQLADPQWTGWWFDADGNPEREARIIPTFHKVGERGGWQCVAVPGPGCWMLRLEYQAADAKTGLAISVIAWNCWIMGVWTCQPRRAWRLWGLRGIRRAS
jgi:hypothetical protein